MAGLACLLTALANMSVDEPLVQEILRAGPHTTNVFSHADGSRIVGAVLYGKPGFALPALPVSRSLHRTSAVGCASLQANSTCSRTLESDGCGSSPDPNGLVAAARRILIHRL